MGNEPPVPVLAVLVLAAGRRRYPLSSVLNPELRQTQISSALNPELVVADSLHALLEHQALLQAARMRV